jgi:hypothetical protein
MEVGKMSSTDAAACNNNNGLGKDVLFDSAHFNNEYNVNISQGCSGTIAAGD